MTERATVIKTDKNGAVVRLARKGECDKCGMCAFPKNASHLDMRASNPVGARVGEEVVIERTEKGKTLGLLLVFLVPLLLIGLAAVLSLVILKKDIWMFFLSLIFLVAWFAVLALIDKKLKRVSGFAPVITKVIGATHSDFLADSNVDVQE